MSLSSLLKIIKINGSIERRRCMYDMTKWRSTTAGRRVCTMHRQHCDRLASRLARHQQDVLMRAGTGQPRISASCL